LGLSEQRLTPDKPAPLFFIKEVAYHPALELDILAYPEATDQR